MQPDRADPNADVVFSFFGRGKGQGAIWDGFTGKLASPGAPAIAGEMLLVESVGPLPDSTWAKFTRAGWVSGRL
jgi:hypothetical protein